MKSKEKILLVHFLGEFIDALSSKGCNDVPESVWKSWSCEERKSFIKEYHYWNKSPKEYNEKELFLPDFAIVAFLTYKLNKELEEEQKK